MKTPTSLVSAVPLTSAKKKLLQNSDQLKGETDETCIFSTGTASKLNVHQVEQSKETTTTKRVAGKKAEKITIVVIIMPTANRLLLRQETHWTQCIFLHHFIEGKKKNNQTKKRQKNPT